MFAYCGNNPVNCADPTGNAYQGIFSQINYNEHDHTYGGLRENFYALPEETFLRKAEKYILNDDESIVLAAKHIAFYKGAFVIKSQIMDDNAFSCGIIFAGHNIDATTLNHEYGHCVHLQRIGMSSYITNVLIPSLIDFWSGTPYSVYYSEPQEYIADMLGGVNRTHNDQPYAYSISSTEAMVYYIYTVGMGWLYG